MKMQIKEFAEFTGVSVRTLRYYDEINLLVPAQVDRFTGYRYYDEQSLLRMQQILFFRELDFSLKSIREILSSPNYDKQLALKEQKDLLILKKERLERLIAAIDGATRGENVMKAFDSSELDQYKAEAQEKWGSTDAYREYAGKTKGYSGEQWNAMAAGMDRIFAEFAACRQRGERPQSEAAQALARKLQSHITENYYTCTKAILAGLGQMYVMDERFTRNIDSHGPGTAEFVSQAICAYCAK